MDLHKRFGNLVRAHRLRLGMKQAELAEAEGRLASDPATSNKLRARLKWILQNCSRSIQGQTITSDRTFSI